jgi:hypothetical protein
VFVLAHTVVHVRVKSPRKHHGGIHFDIYIYLERIANERKKERERRRNSDACITKCVCIHIRVRKRARRGALSIFFGLFSSLFPLFETLETSFFSSSRARESHAQNTHTSSVEERKKSRLSKTHRLFLSFCVEVVLTTRAREVNKHNT